jgi:GT2 family glycosyltransferase
MIAIVTYNGENYIKDCLNSIVTKTNCKIHVFDNNSTDNTIAIIKESYPNVHVTQSTKNLGFGKANNILLESACKEDMDYVFLLNQDAYFIENCLDQLILSSQKAANYIYSPVHLKKDERTLDEGFLTYTQGISDFKNLDFINAAAWLIPMSIVRLVGGFSPLFFHYGEDRDYANRLRFHGYSFHVIEEAKLVHNREPKIWANTKENRAKISNRFYINLLRYLTDINRGLLYCTLIATKNTLGDFIKQVIAGKWRLAFRNLGMYFRCYSQLELILKYRKMAKKQSGVFLELT